MALEIERARGLLSLLIREKVMGANEATQSYEAWVGSGDDAPFSRFVIDLFPNRAEAIRHALRLEAVTGMPRPELFTLERFEDLLVGQLGIEAGMVSPKLLQTVRAVQDKKLQEGKLRRLDELLPRAGFDPKMLEMLYQHLRERVLLCKGCLGRFPRQQMGAFQIECPRCDYNMLADALEPSAVRELPEDQRMALMASSEAVLETISIADRQLARSQRGPNKQAAGGILLGLVGVLGAVVVAVVLLLNDDGKSGPGKTVKPKTTRKTEGKTDEVVGLPEGATSRLQARADDARLFPQGKFQEAIEVWKRVAPQEGEPEGELVLERDRRIRRLEELIQLGAKVATLSADLSDPAKEQELARLLGEGKIPISVPPFAAAQQRLNDLRKGRQAGKSAEAKARYEAALDRVQVNAWGRRKGIAKPKSLLGVELDGAPANGVRVLNLDDDGFEIQTSSGKARRFAWGADPSLSLAVIQAASDPEVIDDQLEVLRRALIARNPLAAAAAQARLPGEASLTSLIGEAPYSVFPAKQSKGGYLARYPTRWVPSDLEPGRKSTLTSKDGVLVLSGNPCRLTSRPIPATKPDAVGEAISAEIELAEAVPGLSFELHLRAAGGERVYLARWGGGKWSLEVGRNKIGSGSFTTAGRRARLSYTYRAADPAKKRAASAEVSLAIDGFPMHSKSTSPRVTSVSMGLKASEALKIRKLRLSGTLDVAAFADAEGRFRDRVAQEIDALGVTLTKAEGEHVFPQLTAEDPQVLGVYDASAVAKLEKGKALLLEGKVTKARAELLALVDAHPKLSAAHYYLAYGALLVDDAAAALVSLEAALDKDESVFPEARALRALAYAKGALREAAGKEIVWVEERRPDLFALHLARARVAYLEADLSERPTAPIGSKGLRLAQILGGADPLVVHEGGHLVTLERLARSLPTRVASDRHVLLSKGTKEQAETALRFLEHTTTKSFSGTLPTLGVSGRVRLVLLPKGYQRLVGDDALAAYVPGLNMVVLSEAPAEPSYTVVRELGRAHLAQRGGPLPAWLDYGWGQLLADRVMVRAKRDKSVAEYLASSAAVTDDDWNRILLLPRNELMSDRLATARAWALVEILPAPTRRGLAERSRDGKPMSHAGMGIEVRQLEGRYRSWIRNRQRGR